MSLSGEKQPTTGRSSHVKFRIKINQYQSHLDVIFCENIFNFANKLSPGILEDKDKDSISALFLTREHPKKKGVVEFFILFDMHCVSVNDIAHEITHFTSFFYEHLGVEHDPQNDEPYAYLSGYVMGTICRRATLKGINILLK